MVLYLHDETNDQLKLGNWPLPRAYGPDEWARLEVRAIGEELTVLVDGERLGTVRDARLLKAGGVGVFAEANAYFRDIVYVPLDKAGGATRVAVDTSEPWRDWVAEKRAEQKLGGVDFEDDGTYARRRTPGGNSWAREFTARDGAIRVTWKLPTQPPHEGVPSLQLRRTDGHGEH